MLNPTSASASTPPKRLSRPAHSSKAPLTPPSPIHGAGPSISTVGGRRQSRSVASRQSRVPAPCSCRPLLRFRQFALSYRRRQQARRPVEHHQYQRQAKQQHAYHLGLDDRSPEQRFLHRLHPVNEQFWHEKKKNGDPPH